MFPNHHQGGWFLPGTYPQPGGQPGVPGPAGPILPFYAPNGPGQGAPGPQVPQATLPWNFQRGDDRGSYKGKEVFKTVLDKCSICAEFKKDLQLFRPCNHYPYCLGCVSKQCDSSVGSLRCPHCKRDVEEVQEIRKVQLTKHAS